MRLSKDDSPDSSHVSQPSRGELDPKAHKQTSSELQDGRCHNVHHREASLPKERDEVQQLRRQDVPTKAS